jgi:hypothetical protein
MALQAYCTCSTIIDKESRIMVEKSKLKDEYIALIELLKVTDLCGSDGGNIIRPARSGRYYG